MLVLIDESGCPGFKLNKGSTDYFVVAMVIFADFKEAENASNAIENLKHSIKKYTEFKFNKTHPEIKDKFFESINKFDFKVRALSVNKKIIYSPMLKNDTDAFYNFFIKNLIKHDQELLLNAHIKIDGRGNRKFRENLGSYLRKEIDKDRIKKFKFCDSKNDNLIQLADMIAGSIARIYNNNRKDSHRWFNIIKGKIHNIWNYQ